MTSREQASAVKYAFVTTNVCKALEHVQRHSPLSERDTGALKKGAELLLEAQQGALWVGGASEMGYSAMSIPVAGRALTTLRALQLES